jgi:hypothetical protein
MFGGSVGPVVSGTLAVISIRAVFVFNFLVYVGLVVAVWTLRRRVDQPADPGRPAGAATG